MLGGAGDIEIVGEAADGAEAVAMAGLHRPDVVLMDIRMPVMDGLTATGELRRRPDAPEVVVLTTSTPTSRCCGRCGPGPPDSYSRTPRPRRSSSRYGGWRQETRCSHRRSPAG